MNCVHPMEITVKRFTSYSFNEHYKVPCGNCINCLIRKTSALEFLAKKELLDVYKSGRGASFVTLTYDDNHIPTNDLGLVTLRKSDVQKFLKNVRRQMEYYKEKIPFKVLYCGEYGDDFGRPHYHIVFLGLTDVQVQKYTKKLWKHGLCDIGVLGAGGLRYLCKYMTKSHPSKAIKQMRENLGVENPFIHHSVGFGKDWILSHVQQIADSDFQFCYNGKWQFYPRYICRFVALRTGKSYKNVINTLTGKKITDYERTINFKEKSYSDLQQEKNYLRYMQNLSIMRSKGITIDPQDIDITKRLKPSSHKDRALVSSISSSLAFYALDSAKYGDVIPF